MTALKNLLAVVFSILLIYAPNVEAADKPRVIVANLETSENSFEKDSDTLFLEGLGDHAEDYILEILVNSNQFTLLDFEHFWDLSLMEALTESKEFEIKSTTPLGRAREIAAQANCDYLFYGDWNGIYGNSFAIEPSFKNGNFQSVKVTMILHVMKVKTGRIVAMVKGEGVSKRSELEHHENLGKNEFPLISLDTATYKAAYDVANKLIKKFSES